MRFVPTRIHGMVDYAIGPVILASPWLLGHANDGAAQWLPFSVGLLILVNALMTDFEFGVVLLLPVPLHLGLDIAAGCLLAVSPWLFGFSDRVWLPHLLLGAFEVVAGLVTRTVPETLLDAADLA